MVAVVVERAVVAAVVVERAVVAAAVVERAIVAAVAVDREWHWERARMGYFDLEGNLSFGRSVFLPADGS